MSKFKIFFLIPLLSQQVFGQIKLAFIAGRIIDETGKPLAYANVQIIGTALGDASNATGSFSFSTTLTGVQKIRATMIGYERAEQTVRLNSGDTTQVNFVLKETLITLQEATVTASAFTSGDEGKGVTLRSMEVVTTPGAAADIFLAVKTFPGLAMIDEGSGLFVRGGDVTETVTILDQATVVHPYKYESPTGGVFGTISPFLVKGTFFSSGGFSARYGNALSGVLAMESQEMPEQSDVNLNLGLAAASLGANLKTPHLGVRFSGNQGYTDVMFRLNGRHDEFTLTPRGEDANLSLIYPYSQTGRLKFFNFLAGDRIGVHVDLPSLSTIYKGEERNQLHNFQWSEVFAERWLVKSSLSLNRFERKSELGNLNFNTADDTYKWRTDVEASLSTRLKLRLGGEIEETVNRYDGKVPQGDVLDPNATTYILAEKYSARRTGAYAEIETQLSRRWLASAGLRGDRQNLASQTTIDPRLSLRYEISTTSNVRASWGYYHQFPQPYEFNPTNGNPNLTSQRAEHFIIGYEYNRDLSQVRVEGYHKLYEELVLKDETRHLANRGNGRASGLDVFVKYGGFLKTRVHGWASYSFLHSRRLLARDLAGKYLYEKAPSDFDVTHNLTIVAKLRITAPLSFGCTYRYATGRPITPIVDAIKDPVHDFYTPVEGPVNSERLPGFQRVDANLSYYYPYGRDNFAVFYLSVANVLNRENILGYEYSADYQSRTPRATNYLRFIYFGVTTTISGF
jgi:hypothetical protein